MARTREFDTDKVLDKAIKLFWHKGYNGVSTQELIDEFKISKSSMYGAFGDKMELFVAALERYRLAIAADTKNRLENCSTIKKGIEDILNSIAKEAMADKDHKGCFVVNSCIELAPHNDKVAIIVRDHRKDMEAMFAFAIKKGIASGELSKNIDPEAVSVVLCSTINGIQVDAKYIRQKKYFDHVIQSTVKSLLYKN